jgi:hypothetical protein
MSTHTQIGHVWCPSARLILFYLFFVVVVLCLYCEVL